MRRSWDVFYHCERARWREKGAIFVEPAGQAGSWVWLAERNNRGEAALPFFVQYSVCVIPQTEVEPAAGGQKTRVKEVSGAFRQELGESWGHPPSRGTVSQQHSSGLGGVMQPVWALWGLCMGPPMAVLAGMEPGTGHRAGEGRLSWPVFLLTLAAVTSSSLSALSLYQLVALRAEVEGLKSEVCRRREEGQDARHGGQVRDN